MTESQGTEPAVCFTYTPHGTAELRETAADTKSGCFTNPTNERPSTRLLTVWQQPHRPQKDIRLHSRSECSRRWGGSAAWRTPCAWGSSSPGRSLPTVSQRTRPMGETSGFRPPSNPKTSPACNAYLQDFHLKPTVRRGPIRDLQGLHEGLRELLHHGEDQEFGCTLPPRAKSAPDTPLLGQQCHTEHWHPRALKVPGSGSSPWWVLTVASAKPLHRPIPTLPLNHTPCYSLSREGHETLARLWGTSVVRSRARLWEK